MEAAVKFRPTPFDWTRWQTPARTPAAAPPPPEAPSPTPAPPPPPRPTEAPQPAAQAASRPLEFGDVCPGWSPAAWAVELRRKATCTREPVYRDPAVTAEKHELADYYDKWAADVIIKHEVTAADIELHSRRARHGSRAA